MKPCIISLATGDKHYAQGLNRLRASAVANGFAGDFRFWPPGQFPPGCPPHHDVPFAFKPYGFRDAQQCGARLVLWLDSACVVVRSLDPLLRQMEQRGYVLFLNKNQRMGEWVSDEALEHLSLSREAALQVPEVNAAAMGLNLAHPVAVKFLEQWLAEARHGLAFRGTRTLPHTSKDYYDFKWNRAGRASADPRVRGHRHDQSVAGVLAARLGLTLTPDWIQSYTPDRGPVRQNVLIVIDRSVAKTEVRPLSYPEILSNKRPALTLEWLRRIGLDRLWPKR